MDNNWEEYRQFATLYLQRKGQGLMIGFVDELVQERIRLQREYPDRVASVKGILNSVYGVMGSPHFRLYVREIPQRVTEVARNIIKDIIMRVEEWGYSVKYSDTDSVYVVVPREQTGTLETKINDYLGDDYSIKLEHYFDSVLFTGKKKRYVGIENGTLHFTGFEFRRSDSSNLTKGLQEEMFGMMLSGHGNKVIDYLKTKVEQVRSAPMSDLVITRTLSRDLKDYNKQKQDYLKSAEESSWLRVGQGDALNTIPALNYPYGVAVFQDESDLPRPVEIDYDSIIQKQIKTKVEDILSLIGCNWSEVVGQRKLL